MDKDSEECIRILALVCITNYEDKALCGSLHAATSTGTIFDWYFTTRHLRVAVLIF